MKYGHTDPEAAARYYMRHFVNMTIEDEDLKSCIEYFEEIQTDIEGAADYIAEEGQDFTHYETLIRAGTLVAGYGECIAEAFSATVY